MQSQSQHNAKKRNLQSERANKFDLVIFGYGHTYYIDCAHTNQGFISSNRQLEVRIFSAITFECNVFINFMLWLHYVTLSIIYMSMSSFYFIPHELIQNVQSWIVAFLHRNDFFIKIETIIDFIGQFLGKLINGSEFSDEAILFNCFWNLIYMTFDPHASAINCYRTQCLCMKERGCGWKQNRKIPIMRDNTHNAHRYRYSKARININRKYMSKQSKFLCLPYGDFLLENSIGQPFRFRNVRTMSQ